MNGWHWWAEPELEGNMNSTAVAERPCEFEWAYPAQFSFCGFTWLVTPLMKNLKGRPSPFPIHGTNNSGPPGRSTQVSPDGQMWFAAGQCTEHMLGLRRCYHLVYGHIQRQNSSFLDIAEWSQHFSEAKIAVWSTDGQRNLLGHRTDRHFASHWMAVACMSSSWN